MYGFHKMVALSDGSMKTAETRSKPILEYHNRCFVKGEEDLLWLIQKPKNTGKKKSAGKKGKGSNGRQDSDEDGISSDDGGVMDNTNNSAENFRGVKMIEDGSQNRAQSTHPVGAESTNAPKADLTDVVNQLEAIRNHQALISTAISRLRNDHNALYQQATAFQTLHDRHEHSINNILGFLATVYDKSLGGHLNGAYSNMFNAVGENQSAIIPGQSPNEVVSPGAASTSRLLRKKAPLFLENGPSLDVDNKNEFPLNNNFGQNRVIPVDHISNYNLKPQNSSTTYSNSTYQSPTIQEILSPSNAGTSPQTIIDSPIPNHVRPVSTSQNQPPQSQARPQSKQTQNQDSNFNNNNMALTPRFELRSPTPGTSQVVLQDHQNRLNATGLSLEELENIQKDQDADINNLSQMMKDVIGDYPDTTINGKIMNNPTPPGNYMSNPFDADFATTSGMVQSDGTNFDDFLEPDLFTAGNNIDYSNLDASNFIMGNGYGDGLAGLSDFTNLSDGRIMSAHGSSSEGGTPDTSTNLGTIGHDDTEDNVVHKKRKMNSGF